MQGSSADTVDMPGENIGLLVSLLVEAREQVSVMLRTILARTHYTWFCQVHHSMTVWQIS